MANDMNCFDWQSRASSILDSEISAELKTRSEAHLKTCTSCQERLGHFQRIRESLKSLPKVNLPEALKANPTTFTLPKIEIKNRRIKWDRTPWFVRAGIEGIGIALVVLVVVATVPKIRSVYERSLEMRLSDFRLSDFFGGKGIDDEIANLPLARGKTTAAGAEGGEPAVAQDEFLGEEEGEDDLDTIGKPSKAQPDIHVGSSEVWRFNLKTDSPHDLRPKVVQLLRGVDLPANLPGIGGIEAPGGIQFDIIAPQEIVAKIKTELQHIAGDSSIRSLESRTVNPLNSLSSDAFTWYKVKSRRTIPQGKARVVIWLSQT